MKYLPIGNHSFEKIRGEDRLYIDKTEYIYQLITRGNTYFLSRPRRFGKSLLISTLAALFEGKRALFKGLWIDEQSDYQFEPHPIVQFDFGKKRIFSPQDLEEHVIYTVNKIARENNIELEYDAYDGRFGELVEKLAEQKPVVILIDEYDKPILDNIDKPARDEIKDKLRGFYAAIKASDPYLRFVLLTGVTKFARVSVFSDLNNLFDLSMDRRYAEMLGITQAELEQYFADRIELLSGQMNISRDELLAMITHWYNGYRFSTKDAYVYNPFSTLLLFEQQEFKHHWFETGTPTFLIELVKRDPLIWPYLHTPQIVSERSFSTYEIEKLEPLPLLFQSGYLTIKEVIQDGFEYMYELDYPNYEVRNAFLSEVLNSFSEVDNGESYIYRLTKHIQAGEVDQVMETLQVFFTNVNYDLHLKYEKYYQTIFFVIFELLKFKVEAEVRTERGRVDVVVEVANFIYLFEFKLSGTKEEALKQIEDQQYPQKYLHRNKKIIIVGAAFDQEKRNLNDWVWEIVEA